MTRREAVALADALLDWRLCPSHDTDPTPGAYYRMTRAHAALLVDVVELVASTRTDMATYLARGA